ncbi:MAG: MoaD/ThiS family protein [Rhodothermia bacterium]|nr:MoaD/ThiS family protein [Rhodothermia bacterium]
MAILTVRIFSVLAERIGSRHVEVELRLPATGEQLITALGQRYSAVDDFKSVIRLAVNREYVDMETVISESDEVAIITPTSGG